MACMLHDIVTGLSGHGIMAIVGTVLVTVELVYMLLGLIVRGGTDTVATVAMMRLEGFKAVGWIGGKGMSDSAHQENLP